MTSLNIESINSGHVVDDFRIVSLPRSGSHMLATALDSHPYITCHGEGAEDWLGTEWYEGNLIGRISLFSELLVNTLNLSRKFIVITRDVDDIVASIKLFTKSSYLHTLRDSGRRIKIDTSGIPISTKEELLERSDRMLHELKDLNTLVLAYEDLTSGGKDIIALPSDQSDTISAFLGVKPMELKPSIEKVVRLERPKGRVL